MPIYEYRCGDCNAKYSVLALSINSKVEPVCTACGSKNATKLVSAFALHSDEGPIVDDPSEFPSTPAKPVFGRKELNDLGKKQSST